MFRVSWLGVVPLFECDVRQCGAIAPRTQQIRTSLPGAVRGAFVSSRSSRCPAGDVGGSIPGTGSSSYMACIANL